MIVAQELAPSYAVYSLTGGYIAELSNGVGWGYATSAAFDPQGHIWTTDWYTNSIYEFSKDGTYLGSVSNSDIAGAVGIAFTVNGYPMVNDRDLAKVCEITGGTNECITGLGVPRGIATEGNYAYVSAETAGVLNRYSWDGSDWILDFSTGGLIRPRGVAIDANGYVYVAARTIPDIDHPDANEIWRFNPDLTGGIRWIDFGAGGYGANGIAFDDAGNLYVVNYFQNNITRYDSNGQNGTVIVSGLNSPSGLAIGEWAPEPSTWMMLGLGLGALLLRRLRR
jgi:DNA-binding beta-propeller fold protein YncE